MFTFTDLGSVAAVGACNGDCMHSVSHRTMGGGADGKGRGRDTILGMKASARAFREPTAVEKLFNRAMGFLVGFGLAPSHMRLLEVRGRKSGKLYATPVDLLELNGKRYLVAPRGRTQWVRNAEAAGEIVLRRGRTRQTFRLCPIPDSEKAPILEAYLDTFKAEVQRFFSVAAGSPAEAFAPLAQNHPAFELLQC
jgi:deazaflavin-dependent oxidoreductase (nitroreductase family)